MQRKRLQKQMEKRKEKELSLQSRGDDQKEPLEISDGLSVLQAGEQNSKTSFEQRVLEDEIEQLRDQLRETVDENGRLYKLLKERDFEIKHLKKKIEEDRFAFTGNCTAVMTVPTLKSRSAGPAAMKPTGQTNSKFQRVGVKRECKGQL
uniref:Uncharacterized protein n=1 Tax=Capra hircus TaxID=9925 RepID=A0A8C2P9G1_CAPHI